jgi:hypothetical protein
MIAGPVGGRDLLELFPAFRLGEPLIAAPTVEECS